MPGAIIFEADVDNSIGTGGATGILGAPVPPCPCKAQAGLDISVAIYARQQGDGSGSAIAASCTDNHGACGRRRESGEWYAITALGGQPIRAIGILRVLLDPTPYSPESPIAQGVTEDCYTLPWSTIIAYGNRHLQETQAGNPANFNYTKARANDYGDGKWQVVIWYDSTD